MWYLVGLGNPGREFQDSRHNAGWMGLDLLQTQLSLPEFSFHKKTAAELSRGNAVTLLKPQTYMNDSGRAVRAVLEYYHNSSDLHQLISSNLVVLHDDLDLELGSYKLTYGKGPKVHNGLLSLYAHLQTDQFWHGRIGVDSRQGERAMPGSDYVLQPFSPLEKEQLAQSLSSLASEIIQKMGIQ